jgi:hypothetical protein
VAAPIDTKLVDNGCENGKKCMQMRLTLLPIAKIWLIKEIYESLFCLKIKGKVI